MNNVGIINTTLLILGKIRKLFNSVTFIWILPYLNKSTLYKNEVFHLDEDNLKEFENEINNKSSTDRYIDDVRKSNKGDKSLLIFLISINKLLILEILIFKTLQILSSSLFSVYLNKFIRLSNNNEDQNIYSITEMSAKLIMVYVLRLVFESQNRYKSGKLGLFIESFLMKLSFSTVMLDDKNNSNNGGINILNVMLGDCSSYPNFVTSLLDLMVFPLKFMLTWYLLRKYIGEVAIRSVIAFVIVFILGFLLQVVGSCLRIPFMRYRDIRIHKTHEFLRNIVHIKLYCEEELYMDEILKVRKKENYYNTLRIFFIQLGIYLDYHVNLISQLVLFTMYISEKIKKSTNLNSELSSLKELGPTGVTILNIFFTVSSIRGITTQLIEGFVSIIRFQSYMKKSGIFLNDDNDCKICETDNTIKNMNSYYNKYIKTAYFNDYQKNGYLVIISKKDQNFRDNIISNYNNKNCISNCLSSKEINYNFKTESLVLQFSNYKDDNIDFNIRFGEKVFIIGESGSGKTSFVNYLLSKNKCFSNKYVYHIINDLPIGYVSQKPWLPNGTIKSIILFGLDYDENVYSNVVESCNLFVDFRRWKEGDLKIINEGGDTLSKGQKTRICLARTLYQFFYKNKNEDINSSQLFFIFDDIFTNLDQIVANKIFHKLFGKDGLLSSAKISVVTTIDEKVLAELMWYCCNIDKNYELVNFFPNNNYLSHYKFYSIINSSNIKPIEMKCCSNSQFYTLLYSTYINTDSSKYKRKMASNDTKHNVNGKTLSKFPSSSSLCIDNVVCGNENKIDIFDEKFNKKGNISVSSYIWYLKNIGKCNTIIILLILFLKSLIERICELLFTGQIYYKNTNLSSLLALYTTFSIFGLISGIILYVYESITCTICSNRIHNKLLNLILLKVSNSVPVYIFLNRFGGDMYILDTCIIKSIISTILPILTVLGQLVYIIFNIPYFTIPFLFIWFAFYIFPISKRFIISYREYQRFLISVYSNIFGVISCSQTGLATIKTLKKENILTKQAYKNIGIYIKIKYIQLISTQWAGFWLNIGMTPVGIFINVIICISKFYFKNSNDDTRNNILILNILSSAQLCIYYFPSIAEAISSFMYKYVQMEKEMCSVERIFEFINSVNHLELENITLIKDSYTMDTNVSVSDSESNQGLLTNKGCGGLIIEYLEIVAPMFLNRICHNTFDGIKNKAGMFSYETVLLVDCKVSALSGEVIGVIGRTGSGKSSLINSIMGLNIKRKGKIVLNGLDLVQIYDTEKNRINKIIGLLAQDEYITKNKTIRYLLDPFSEYNDDILLSALRECGLGEFLDLLYFGLDTQVQLELEHQAEHNINVEWSEQYDSDKVVSPLICQKDVSDKCNIPKSSFNKDFLNYGHLSDKIVLSISQLRYLLFVRLTINPLRYQLLLLDEPPNNVIFSLGNKQIHTLNIVNSILSSSFSHCPVLIVSHNIDILRQCTSFWIMRNNKLVKVINNELTD